jgi:hypothetical protein
MGSDPGYNLGTYDGVSFPLPYSPAGVPALAAANAANAQSGFSGF